MTEDSIAEVTFSSFQFHDSVMDALDSMNFRNPTPIQQKAIPQIMAGRDLIACAQTGTGKTAAFLLPLLHKLIIDPPEHGSIGALVIVPTRELAAQIDQQLEGLGYFTNLSSLAISGGGTGSEFDVQRKALSQGADFIIATPGKLLSHINLGYVNFKDLKAVVLDEADRMLDMGFFDDIMRIIRALPENRQTLMFSATMPKRIRDMAHRILKHPEEISLSISKPAAGVAQLVYGVQDHQKIPLLKHVLADQPENGVILFAGTKRKVKDIAFTLKKAGIKSAEIHSDLEQSERTEVLRQFKNRQIPLLVATDVLSRGIDIEDLGMVINFDVPGDPEDYVHRVGRTARANSTGRAVTLVNADDAGKIHRIESLIGYEIPRGEVPEELGEGYTIPQKGERTGRSSSSRSNGKPRSSGGKGRRFGPRKGKPGPRSAN